MTMLDRRSALAAMAGFAATPALSQVAGGTRPVLRPEGWPPTLDPAELTRARVARTSLSGLVTCALVDARSGETIVARNAGERLPPASVTKAITAAYALDVLGPGHRYRTQILMTGPMRNGVLEGDLILAGTGAPGLSTADLAELAGQARANGLREVTGGLHVWAGALPQVEEISPGQPDYLTYNPSVSGLNLNYNRVHFEWRRQGREYVTSMGAPAGTFGPEVGQTGVQLSDRSSPIYSYRRDPETGREIWSVARGALGASGARWLPVRDGGLYSGDVFRTLLANQGVTLPFPTPREDPPPETAAILAGVYGPPMSDVITDMLRYSTNLTAEALGLTATVKRLGRVPADLRRSGAEMSAWARETLGFTQARFVDHSGLGDESRLSAAEMCEALVRLGPEGALHGLLPNIALYDESGAAESFTLSAKTGTLNFVSALSGHIARAGRRPLAFAIFTGDLESRARIPEGDEDSPPGSRSWTRRSRAMQYDLCRIWSRLA